jgi:hypothetical protein
MKEVTHYRKGKNVISKSSGTVSEHKTVNGAKRESRKIQMEADRALGRGTVRVTPRKLNERIAAFDPQPRQIALVGDRNTPRQLSESK